MFLNVWDEIRNFFSNMLSNISFSSVFTLLFGVFIGILISVVVYALTLLKNVNKEDKNKLDSKEVDSELINKLIKESQDEYDEASSDMNVSNKIDLAKELGINLATNIAKTYYPNSKHPLFELSVDELIMLDYYIMERVEKLFDRRVLRRLKKVKISSILNILDKKKEIDENKIVKGVKKLNVGGVVGIVKNAMNAINPVYYMKKIGVDGTIKYGLNGIIKSVLKIIGEETAIIYSKNAFKAEEDIDIDSIIDEGKDE